MNDWRNDTTATPTTNYDNLIKNLSSGEKESVAGYVGMKKNDFLKRLSTAWEKDKKKDVFDQFGEKSGSKQDAMDVDSIAASFAEPETPAAENTTTASEMSPAFLQALEETREMLRSINEAKKSKY
jgi:hypothetical protein